MEIAALILLILAERARPDLYVRRWWAGLGLPRPALPVQVPVPVALAGVEARRLVFRVTSLGGLLIVLRMLPPTFDGSPYEGVNALVGFGWAIVGLTILALVAATSGRDRGQELLEALPRGGRSRVLSWSVLLIGAAAVEYGVLLVMRYGPASPQYAALLPNPWELAQGPLMLVGGGLLGLLGARYMPSWVAAPVCVVLSVVWVGSFAGPVTSTRMVTPLVEWIQYREDGLIVVEPGNFAWHNAFLLGLCGLGLLAALLREPGPRRALFIGAAGIVAATAAAGALALP
jgi:hypothetical protein